jgi:hypothetical protein
MCDVQVGSYQFFGVLCCISYLQTSNSNTVCVCVPLEKIGSDTTRKVI